MWLHAAQVIPEMTDPMGWYWDQPPLSEITISDDYAYMSQATYDRLHVYNHSMPTGVYPGKMWRRYNFLQWFGEEVGGACTTHYRTIMIRPDHPATVVKGPNDMEDTTATSKTDELEEKIPVRLTTDHPEDALEEKIPVRSMEEALKIEQLRARLSAIRSSIAHIERNMMRDGITAEELDVAVGLAIAAESSVFAVRFSLGYP